MLSPHIEIKAMPTGGAINLSAASGIGLYIIDGTVTLASNIDITYDNTEDYPFPLGGSSIGVTFTLLYQPTVTLSGNTVTVFGKALSASEAVVSCLIVATCDSEDGSTFDVTVIPDFSTWALWITSGMFSAGAVNSAALATDAITTAKIAALQVTGAKIADLTITTGKLALLCITTALLNDGAVTTAKLASDSVTTIKILDQNVTTSKIALLAITTALINDLAVTTGKINNLAVTTAKLDDLSVTLAKIANGIIDASKLTTSSNTEVISASLSFETGQQGAYQILVPYNCTLVGVYYQVVKALSNTDEGTIQLQNDSLTNMTGGLTTFALSTAFGTTASAAPSANNTFTAGQKIRAVTAKTTVGGILQAFFTVQRT